MFFIKLKDSNRNINKEMAQNKKKKISKGYDLILYCIILVFVCFFTLGMEIWPAGFVAMLELVKLKCVIGTSYTDKLFLSYFQKMKANLSNNQCVCVSVYVSPSNNFWTARWIFWNLVDRYCHSRWPRRQLFSLVASAIPKWKKFKLLRWV
jgi:hypothetical protein